MTGGRRIKGSGAAKIAKPNAPIKLTSREIDALRHLISLAEPGAGKDFQSLDYEALGDAMVKLAALKQRLLTKEAVS
jgi:hypothetical protein